MAKILRTCFNILVIALVFSCSSSDDNQDDSGVQDMDNPIPELSISNLDVSIPENPAIDFVIGTFVTNQENLTDPINFSIIEQSVAGAVAINNVGQLLVANIASFNFESNSNITGSVRISSGSLSDTAEFTINITDVEERSGLPFITKWNLPSNNLTIKLPIYEGSDTDMTEYDFTVDWGDGTLADVTSFDDEDATHTYSTDGEKTVSVTGTLKGFSFGQIIDSSNLFTDVVQWGDVQLGNAGGSFTICVNLLGFSAEDVPNLAEVTNFDSMFIGARNFNGDLSGWDMSSVTNMHNMFWAADSFNQDISSWDVSSVSDMSGMFVGASSFNQDISSWNIGNVRDMSSMFSNALVFNQDISSWDVSNVTDMSSMFSGADSFNQDISVWNVSNVTDMSLMFRRTDSFNQDLSTWNVSNVTNMRYMFDQTDSFNQDISSWDVSSVTDMAYMFQRALAFNQDLSAWDVSNVNFMNDMFANAISFNQDINTWDVGNVVTMERMFAFASLFNQDISGWDVSNVTDMSSMFSSTVAFDQDISSWDVSSVTNMAFMFANSDSFNQDLSGWPTENVTNCAGFNSGSALLGANLPVLGCFAP